MDTAVAVSQLSVRYRGGFRSPAVQALTGVDFEVSPGAIVGILGPNGSGKTTLGRALLGLAPVTEGSVTYAGRDIGQLLISAGWALPDRSVGLDYVWEEMEAEARSLGLWQGRFVTPERWRAGARL